MSESTPDAPGTGTGTGNAEVDAALAHLNDLDDLPVERHPEVFDTVHAQLRSVLTDGGHAAAVSP